MSAEIIFMMVMGHLIGDYFLQNNWMALNKKKDYMVCSIHCVIYTVAVCACVGFCFDKPLTMEYGLGAYLGIAGTHFLFDYTNIVDRYLALIKGRSWQSAIEKFGTAKLSFAIKSAQVVKECDAVTVENLEPKIESYIYLSYTTLVQTVVDNVLHIVCNYIILKIFL